MRIYTAGHSTSELRAFVEMIAAAGVELVADVRSKPRSRLPHFDQIPLEEALGDAGVSYRLMGDKLGGMPRDPKVAARWRQGHLDALIVDHLRSTDEWTEGIGEMAKIVRRGTAVCLVCSEADPNECHRKAVALDVAAALGGAEIVHLSVSGGPQVEVGVQEVLL